LPVTDRDLLAQLAEVEAVARHLRERLGEIHALAAEIQRAIRAGHRVLTCGNGGSAAEAAHLATELLGRYKGDRPALPALALNTDGALLTCIGNDFGYDALFARQVAGLGQAGDVLVLFTTSGNSRNLVEAACVAKAQGLFTAALLGKDGGALRGVADWELLLPFSETARVQEGHLMVVHLLSELLEEYPSGGCR
jgi:D-sedoheptulose 7-phosphate isomerase